MMKDKAPRETDRLIAFSDAVIAIAITLLVLPLTDIRPEGEDAVSVLVDNRSALLCFALTFAVIAGYWMTHHAVLRSLRDHNRTLIRINTAWLAMIVLLPFPTSLIGRDIHHGYATLYISTLAGASIMTLILTRYLLRHPELRRPGSTDDLRRRVASSWAALPTLAVAIGISLVSPRLGMLALLLLVPASHLGALVSQRRRAGDRTSDTDPAQTAGRPIAGQQ